MTQHNRPQTSKRAVRFLRELQGFNVYAAAAFIAALLALSGWLWLQ